MAISISTSCFDQEATKDLVIEKCCVKPKVTQYNTDPTTVTCFAINRQEKMAYLPLGIWRDFYDKFPDRTYPPSKIKSKKVLYTIATDPKHYRDQDQVVKEAIVKLKSDKCVFLALATGFGKTTIAAYLSCQLGLKTAVLCHLDKVNEQWIDEYEKFTTAKVQRVKGKALLDPAADVYVIGVRKSSMMLREQLKDIGIVIFDEAHISTVTAFSVSLLKFRPRYVIGLSATPRRADGMHKLINMFFGPKKNFIIREETKDFQVYKIETPYKPKVTYKFVATGVTLDWCSVLNSLAYNEKRQDYIVDLVLTHPDHRIMILSDRQKECRSIYDKLIAKKETLTILITGETTTKGVNTMDYRVLVAGMKKAGVGFNDPTLTMLIIATDVKNVEQMEGRIRTSNNIIYDLVDDFSTLETHWGLREKWYLHRGATIKTISQRASIPYRRLLV